jgi:hypothetical protein
MIKHHRARLVGIVRDGRAEQADTLTFEDISDRAIRDLRIKVDKVNWFSTYHVHHRWQIVFDRDVPSWLEMLDTFTVPPVAKA